ncbi:hypothetical protein [Pseudoduganella albidiflava]|uniref:Uncharacterized protein n=1 Tax=Pseudoduganella albidiflava TaxID=321983 RepID=A0A411WX07_9BURK|nr:hypothetical protein [Pseudoduganella albidiflava]QBI01122.1 hypothetical protein EYF70_09920 [Pseudoduganella albidiflava]GGY48320.1 hypothetical protein GCM10007387_33110 [Pseudoduganella albidiflava]
MSNSYNSFDLADFPRRYLKPLLVDALQARLAAWPVALALPPAAVADPLGSESGRSGVPEGVWGEPCFVATDRGWTWRDHALLAWRTGGALAHQRISEQERRYDIYLSEQPDMAGVPRLTVDLHALQTCYERDAITEGACDLGAGWARLTQRWSLRLQLIVTAAGRVNVITRASRPAPRMDAGRSGPWPGADPLARLLDVRRLTRDWEQGGASLGAVRDQLVSRLAAAIEPPLARSVPQFA